MAGAPKLPKAVIDLTDAKSSEPNLRHLYGRGALCLGAASWDELATWRRGAAGISRPRAAEK